MGRGTHVGPRGAQDTEFLSDLNGMMRYLAMKINLGSQCLYCEKSFSSAEAARKHMIDKGHCKLQYGQLGDEDAEEDLEVSAQHPLERERVRRLR